jgi:hypothetical protein
MEPHRVSASPIDSLRASNAVQLVGLDWAFSRGVALGSFHDCGRPVRSRSVGSQTTRCTRMRDDGTRSTGVTSGSPGVRRVPCLWKSGRHRSSRIPPSHGVQPPGLVVRSPLPHVLDARCGKRLEKELAKSLDPNNRAGPSKRCLTPRPVNGTARGDRERRGHKAWLSH